MEGKNLAVLIKESGITETKTNVIAESLQMFFDEAQTWQNKVDSIIVTDVSQKLEMKNAREHRLEVRSKRLKAEEIIKAKRLEIKNRLADEVLIDKLWMNAGAMVSATLKNIEGKFEEKEKFADRWNAQQAEKMKAERLDQLSMVVETPSIYPVENMTQEEFDKLYYELETAMNARHAAEQKQNEINLENLRRQQNLIVAGFFFDGLTFTYGDTQFTLEYVKGAEKAKFDAYVDEISKEIKEAKKKAVEALESSESERRKLVKKAQEDERLINEARQILAKNKIEEQKIQAQKNTDAKMTPEAKFRGWIIACELGEAPFENNATIDIREKFEGFKKWAFNRLSQDV
jgi:hypothetical protein